MSELLTADRLLISGCTICFLFFSLFAVKLWKSLFHTMSELGEIIWKELAETPLDKWTIIYQSNSSLLVGFSNDTITVDMSRSHGSIYYNYIELYKTRVCRRFWRRDVFHISPMTLFIWDYLRKHRNKWLEERKNQDIDRVIEIYKKGTTKNA